MGELTFSTASGPLLLRSSDSAENGRFAPVAFVAGRGGRGYLPQGKGQEGTGGVLADPAVLVRALLECPC